MKRILIAGLIILLVMLSGCSKGTTTTGEAVKEVRKGSCEDSDNGIVMETAGKVSGISGNEEYTLYDRCSAGLLIEYYCDGDEYQNQNIRCPEGKRCLSGKCRE